MGLKETRFCTLTRKEVFALKSLLINGIEVFALSNKCADLMFRDILEQTLPYSKYVVVIPHAKFTSVTPRPGKFNATSIRQMRRHRVWLVEKGLLFYERRSNIGLYLPNIPGIGKGLCRVYEAYGLLDNATIARGREILEKVEHDFDRNFYPTNEVALVEGFYMRTVEEMLEKAEEQNRQGKKRRIIKEDKKDLTPNNVPKLIKRLCEEHGEKFFDPAAFDEQGKFLGSCRNFLKYWKKRDEDPREFLDKVVRYWSEFRTKRLKTALGFPITLPTTVSFTKFFLYRAEIEGWIKFAEKRKESELKVVVMPIQRTAVAEELEDLEKLISDD